MNSGPGPGIGFGSIPMYTQSNMSSGSEAAARMLTTFRNPWPPHVSAIEIRLRLIVPTETGYMSQLGAENGRMPVRVTNVTATPAQERANASAVRTKCRERRYPLYGTHFRDSASALIIPPTARGRSQSATSRYAGGRMLVAELLFAAKIRKALKARPKAAHRPCPWAARPNLSWRRPPPWSRRAVAVTSRFLTRDSPYVG